MRPFFPFPSSGDNGPPPNRAMPRSEALMAELCEEAEVEALSSALEASVAAAWAEVLQRPVESLGVLGWKGGLWGWTRWNRKG